MANTLEQQGTSQKPFLIWDLDSPAPKGPWVRILWRAFNGENKTDTISIPEYVEEHADSLRKRYLEWIYDLGETRIRGKRLIDHLAFEGDFSCWWMTLFVEKSVYKSPIADAVRLLALEEVFTAQLPRHVRLVSSNVILNLCISCLCGNLGIAYEWKRISCKKRESVFRGLYRRLPHTVRGIATLFRHIFSRWALKSVRGNQWFGGDNAVFLCSYFIHLDQDSCSKGQFYSRQWEVLPELLAKSGFRTNWIHHFLRSSVISNTKAGLDWVRRFNKSRHTQGFHQFVDSFLSWKIILHVASSWLKLVYASLRLREVRSAFKPNGSNIDFWHLLRNDWYASMIGSFAVRNLLWISLFDAAIRSLPHQKIGFYLFENQGWEKAFIHAWRKHGHGALFGVVHATVRFWDLRHFSDARAYSVGRRHALPQPDSIILNGRVALDAYIQGGTPMENIVEAEALRFLYLADLKTEHRETRAPCERVLVLGGIMPESTRKMLELLDSASSLIAGSFNFTFKPHPNCMVTAEEYPRLNLTLATDPLARIMLDYDIVYASNSTSAGVDAYLAGLPVVVMLDDNELNMSPLRGQSGVQFVSTSTELAKAFSEIKAGGGAVETRRNFFFLNPELPRWKKLINNKTSRRP